MVEDIFRVINKIIIVIALPVLVSFLPIAITVNFPQNDFLWIFGIVGIILMFVGINKILDFINHVSSFIVVYAFIPIVIVTSGSIFFVLFLFGDIIKYLRTSAIKYIFLIVSIFLFCIFLKKIIISIKYNHKNFHKKQCYDFMFKYFPEKITKKNVVEITKILIEKMLENIEKYTAMECGDCLKIIYKKYSKDNIEIKSMIENYNGIILINEHVKTRTVYHSETGYMGGGYTADLSWSEEINETIPTIYFRL